MVPPPHCQQQFPDDPEIQDGDQMLRRVPPGQICYDENLGRRRPSRAAFEDDKDHSPMSMYRRTVIEASGDTVARVLRGHDSFGLVALTAGHLRGRDQTVHSDPVEDEPSHALVCGRKTDSNRKFFYMNSVWVVLPPES